MRNDVPLQGLLRDLATLVGLIFFLGLIHLIAYYGQFGLRFSDVGLEYHHILYRGLLMISWNWQAAGLPVFMLIALLVDLTGYRLNTRPAVRLSYIVHLGILLCFPLAFFVGNADGFEAAKRDMAPATTTLRQLHAIKGADGGVLEVFRDLSTGGRTPYIVYRASNRLVVISPPTLATAGTVRANVTTIFLRSGDYYEEK